MKLTPLLPSKQPSKQSYFRMEEIKKIKVPIFGQSFYVSCFETNEELEAFLQTVPDYHTQDLTDFDGLVTERGGEIYVFLRRASGYPTPGIIAHEAKHLVNLLFGYIGHRLDMYNDEVECYLLGWCVNRIHEVVNGTYNE